MWKCEWWRLHKTTTNGKQLVREKFPYRRSLTDYQLLEDLRNVNLYGNVQCDIVVPGNLRAIC